MSAPRPIMAKGVASSLPLDLILDTIPSLPRPVLSRMVARMIERLDEMDGDPDVEPNGDESDHSGGEDDCDPTCERIRGLGPGCPLSEPGEIDHRNLRPTYDGEDQSVIVLPAAAGVVPYRYRVS